MHKYSRGSIGGAVGLAFFGVVYDSGFVGPTDGHDHSAVFSIAATNTGASSTIFIVKTITGEDVVIPPLQQPSMTSE